MHSLIRIFSGHIFGYSQGCKVSTCGQRRLQSDCADAQSDWSLRWTHVRRYIFSRCHWKDFSVTETITYHKKEKTDRKGDNHLLNDANRVKISHFIYTNSEDPDHFYIPSVLRGFPCSLMWSNVWRAQNVQTEIKDWSHKKHTLFEGEISVIFQQHTPNYTRALLNFLLIIKIKPRVSNYSWIWSCLWGGRWYWLQGEKSRNLLVV